MPRLSHAVVTRLPVLLVAAALVASACSAGASSPSKSPTPTIRPHSDPRPTSRPADTGDNDILVLRTASGGYQVIFGATGENMFRLPAGAVSQGWGTVATAEANGKSTTVELVAGEGGEQQRSVEVAGAWRLPTIGLAESRAGISADGRTVVLEEARVATAADRQTRFAIVSTTGRTKPRVIALDGWFSFDALSPRGNWLYLIEHTSSGGETYQVRRASTVTGRLDEGVIIDKRNPDEVMQGYPVTQRAGTDGWVYTLYRGDEGAFIHALDTENGGAFCIDLPDTDSDDEATAAWWGLALDNGPSLYAANGKTGNVFRVDLQDFVVAGHGVIPKQVGAIELAKFESGAWAAAGTAALDPAGEALFVATDRGVAALRTSDLSLLSRLDETNAYRSIVVGGSGVVYGIDSKGALVRLGSTWNPFVQPLARSGYASIEALVTFR